MLIVLLLLSTLMFAQRGAHRVGQRGKPSPEAMATRRADRMKAELSLTDDQYIKVKTIYLKFADSQAKIRQDSTLARDASREETKKLMTASEEEVNAVLTPEQRTKWEEFKKTQRDRRGKGGRLRGQDDTSDDSGDSK